MTGRSSIAIRLLGPDDAELILTSDAFDYPADPVQTQAFLDDDRHVIMGAILDGELVGFASGIIHLHPDKQPMLFVSEVGVNERHRRRGIGERLVRDLLTATRARNIRGVWLATESYNVAARNLYARLAGRETRHIVVFDWDGAMDH